MLNGSIVGAIRASPRTVRYSALALMLVLVFALGVSSVFLAPPGSRVASWWPAAAMSVLAALCVRGPRWRIAVAIWVASTASNVVAGRPFALAVGFGAANAVEAWMVAAVIDPDRKSAPLDSLPRVGRFVIGVVAGAVTIGLIAGLAAWLLDGGDIIGTFLRIVPSHASAVLVVVPVALVRRRRLDPGRRGERAVQALVLGATLCVVFWPGQVLPLAFLPLPLLIWAALRFGMQLVTWELFGTALIASFFTGAGGGPFPYAAAGDPAVTTILVQIFLIVYASSILFTAAGRIERERLVEQLDAREQLLRGGLVGAQIGLLIVQADAGNSHGSASEVNGSVRLLEGNEMAGRLLGISIDSNPNDKNALGFPDLGLPHDHPFLLAVHGVRRANDREGSREIEVDSGRHRLQVFISRVASGRGTATLTAQVIDVTARHEAELATRAALDHERETSDRLNELARQKDDFVSSVTHELRTPITSIVGYAEELEDSDLEPAQAGFARVVLRNAHRLARLVEDLLELSRMSAREDFRRSEDVDVDSVIEECVEDLGPAAKVNGVTLRMEGCTDPASLRCVPQDLARIVTNLVSNSVKFSPSGGTVSVASFRSHESVRIEVTDEGIGIPPAEIDRVLERFYRSSTSSVLPGTGLGLALVKGLIDGLGGTLKLESDGSSGTRAIVELPISPAVAA